MSIWFHDDPNQPKRALQIWQILIGKAHNRQTMTYGELSNLIGFKRSGTLGGFLAPVMFYCQDSGLPPLSCLVVNQDTGLPGEGLTSPTDLHAEREKVFRFEWYKLVPPSIDDFKQAASRS
jgi:hypothetical protein